MLHKTWYHEEHGHLNAPRFVHALYTYTILHTCDPCAAGLSKGLPSPGWGREHGIRKNRAIEDSVVKPHRFTYVTMKAFTINSLK